MKEYESRLKKSPYYGTRRSIFNAFEHRETHYKHQIPTQPLRRVLKQHGMRGDRVGYSAKGDYYAIMAGRTKHGDIRVNKKSGKVDWWYIK